MPEAKPNRSTSSTSLQRRDTGVAHPFALMDQMAEEMDRAFDRMFRGWGLPRRREAGLWSPRVEAFQRGDRFIVRADLPGLKKDDVHVEVTEDAITIHGDRREEHEEQREGYYRSEREYGEFYRTVPLPDGAIADSAQANFKDGVLEVTLQAPPAEATRGRRLEIKDVSGSEKK